MLQWLDLRQPPIRVLNPARCNKPCQRVDRAEHRHQTIWTFVDNQAAIRRCLKPHPTAGQHLSLQIIDNIQTILNTRPDTQVRIQWLPGHTAVPGNDNADACAKRAAQLPPRRGVSFMSLAFLRRQLQLGGQREWQQVWKTCSTGSSYTTTAN